MSVPRSVSILGSSLALLALLFLAACGGGTNEPPPGDGPYVRTQKLTASDAAAYDHFGYLRSVAVDGNRIVVGAHNKDARTGAAYVYELQGTTWTQVQKLEASDGLEDEAFGHAVALDGEYAFIAAQRVTDGGHFAAGVVYVFQLVGGTWTEVDILKAPFPSEMAWFGWSIDTDGDRVIVGAHGTNSGSGAAYVFHLEEGEWVLRGDVTASDAAAEAYFGIDVAIEGDTAIVGAWANATNGAMSGAAYVFEFGGEEWLQTDKLSQASPAVGDRFGNTVTMLGDYALIAAPGDNEKGTNSGSVRVFQLQSGNWTEVATLLASDGAAWDDFGTSIAMHGEFAVVGAYRWSTSSSRIGSAYVFERSGTTWSEVDRFVSGGGVGDLYGMAATMDGDWLVIGTPNDNERATQAGAVFVYARTDE